MRPLSQCKRLGYQQGRGIQSRLAFRMIWRDLLGEFRGSSESVSPVNQTEILRSSYLISSWISLSAVLPLIGYPMARSCRRWEELEHWCWSTRANKIERGARSRLTEGKLQEVKGAHVVVDLPPTH